MLLPQSHLSFPNVSSSIAAAAAAAAVSHGADDMNSSTIYTNNLFDTFHQMPHGDFKPTFYNPFEIKHRRRTSRAQFKVLERTFMENPKPSAAVRRILAQKLNMTPRGVQVWFQNRRAKAKLQKQQDEKQRLEGSVQSDPNSPNNGTVYSSPSTSSQASASPSEFRKNQRCGDFSAINANVQDYKSMKSKSDSFNDRNSLSPPKYHSHSDNWFASQGNMFNTSQYGVMMNNGLQQSAMEQSLLGSMRPASYEAALLRRKSCPEDLMSSMYPTLSSPGRDKLETIPEGAVPSAHYVNNNMSCYMNPMQMRISRRMSEPCISNSASCSTQTSYSPLLCRAYSMDSTSTLDQEQNIQPYPSASQTMTHYSLQSQLNEFNLGDNNMSSDSNANEQHPLENTAVDSINLQVNSFNLVDTPVSMSMSI
ncbi:hypothetical protein INT43_004140 [Umbelopsis isabellina]|uniref:Homeobox domain-containing protein n=1 Tax=Mortierella isabellina TaxID=91625 RepID=A0A8H7PHY1_MORIS|nr:hypothetical protein INT43_004140 [Umbelopsis isabellina]